MSMLRNLFLMENLNNLQFQIILNLQFQILRIDFYFYLKQTVGEKIIKKIGETTRQINKYTRKRQYYIKRNERQKPKQP